MQGVEQQPQLVGQRRRIFLLLFVVFFLVLGLRHGREDQAAADQVGVEPRRRQRPRRQSRPAAARARGAAAAAAFPARSPSPGGVRCGRRCRAGRGGRRRTAGGRCGRRAACRAPASASRGRRDSRRRRRAGGVSPLMRRSIRGLTPPARLGRRRRVQRHEPALGQRQQHAVELLLAGRERGVVHEPLAQHRPHLGDFRRNLQQVRQQPPRQRPLAVELARRGALQLLELRLAPVDGVLAARRLLLFESLFRLEQARVARVLGDLVVLLLPAQDAHVVLVGQGVDEAAVVELRPAGPAEDLVGGAGVDQLLLAARPLHQRRQHHRPRRQVDAGRQRLGADARRPAAFA